MLINMSAACGSTLEEQLSSVMDVLAKAAVSEIGKMFSEGSAALRLQITQSRKENEELRTRMAAMKSVLFSLRANVCKPRTASLGNEDCDAILHVDATGSSLSGQNSELRIVSVQGHGGRELLVDDHDTLFTASQNSPSADYSVGKGTKDCDAASEILRVDATGSSGLSCQNSELRIVSVQGHGGRELVVDGHDTLFTASPNSPSADYKGTSLNPLMDPKAIGHSPFHSPSIRDALSNTIISKLETPDILLKVEEDISDHRPAEVCQDIDKHTRDGSAQHGATSDSLHPDGPGPSSHVSGHDGEPRVPSVHGEGGGQLVADGRETLSSPSVDRRVAKFRGRGRWLVRCEKLIGPRGGREGQPGLLCGKVSPNDPNEVKIHRRSHTSEKPHRCDQCHKGFKLSGVLKTHMLVHSREKPYRCDRCTKCFSQRGSLTVHMRTHSGEKPYRCAQCVKCFSQSFSLKVHMKSHSRERPFKCDICAKHFIQSGHLKNHMVIHSRERHYRCDQCMKSFRRNYDLKMHARTHAWQKPYRCDQCTKRFSQKCHLKKHVLATHPGVKPYRCDQCTKSFGQSSHLKKHRTRVHSREKPYRCDQCTRGFSQSCHLKVHLMTHIGEKPCVCPQCTASFSDPRLLRGHMIKAHGQCGALTRVTGTF